MNLRANLSLFFRVASRWSLSRHSKRCLKATLISLLAILFSGLAASASTPDVCDRAAHRAAEEFDVPFAVLWSITRTETGRYKDGKLNPWPWTVNMEGKGHWFKTRRAAQAYAAREFERGARSFDVGCFQINYKWHGASFRSIDQMFDPIENARYAAAFLARLYRESGNWSIAAGAYHSRTQEFSKRYRARFDRIHANYGSTEDGSPYTSTTQNKTTTPITRENTYPLLVHADRPARNGSLVPLMNNQSRALFTIPGMAEDS